MAKETKKSTGKYKAVNPKEFALTYNSAIPKYEELSSGESVNLDPKNKHTKNLLDNKIIIKE